MADQGPDFYEQLRARQGAERMRVQLAYVAAGGSYPIDEGGCEDLLLHVAGRVVTCLECDEHFDLTQMEA